MQLLLTLATTKASTLRGCTATSATSSATSTTAAAASTASATASTTSTAATDAPTPGTTPTTTSTSSTASSTAPSTTLASLTLASAADHFLALDPTALTVDLLEQHLLAAETNVVAVGAARGTPRTPFFEGCSPSPLSPSYASAAAVDVLGAEDVGAASTSAKRRSSKGKGGRGGGGGSKGGGGGSSGGGGGNGGGGSGGSGGRSGGFGSGGGGSGESGGSGSGGSGGGRTGAQRGGSGGGQRQPQQRRSETPSPQQLSEWFARRGASGGSVSCPYVIRTGDRAGQTCGKAHTQHHCFSHLDEAWRAESGDEAKRPRWAELLRSGVAIFDLDHDAILAAMYALSFSAEGDCYLRVPPDRGIEAAALGASEFVLPGTASAEALHTFTLDSGASRCLHLPSFPTNLVSTAAFQDAMVITTTPGGQRVSICTCTRTGCHLATFTRWPRSSLYTLANEPPQIAASTQVSASGQVAPPCSCRLLLHETLMWHHRLGHPSLPRLRGMHSRLLVSSLPRSLPPLPPLPTPPCLPCVKGRQRATPHSSLFSPTTSPLQTLHMDVGGEFSSDLLWNFCCGEGILQSFTLPESPQQIGIPERRIGLVMEVARTSMIHAAAPHFLRPFAVRYAAHQLNLWPRVSLPETSPTQRWTGKVGDASVFRVWGSHAFVHDTSADKLSARAIPCVFLGFSPDVPGWQFYHLTSRRVFPSQDVTFDESVPFYCLIPYRSAPPHPRRSSLLQVDPLLGTAPVEVAVGSGAARGAASRGAASGGAKPGGAESEGARSEGAEPGGAEPGGAEPTCLEPGVAESEGAEFGGAAPRAGDSAAGDTRAGGAGVTAGACGIRVVAAAGPGGARTRGTGAAGTGGVGGAGAGDPTEPGDTGAGGAGAVGAGAEGTGAGGAGAGGAGAVDPGARGARGTVWPRPDFVPLLQQVLGVPSATDLTPPLLCPQPDQSQSLLHPASPLLAPSPYAEQTGSLTERHEPAYCPTSHVCTARRIPRPRPPPVPLTLTIKLRPSSVPLRVPLPPPP
ncbi:unnamed protein product [Closterium sp. NIES-53]